MLKKKCPSCGGDGAVKCPECVDNSNKGGLGPIPSDVCNVCNGSGKVTCSNCDGTGKIKINN